jgi:hypothetical protein
LSGRRQRRVDELRGHDDDVVVMGGDDGIEPLVRNRRHCGREAAQLGGHDARRHGIGPLTVAPPDLAVGYLEYGGDDRDTVMPRHVEVGPPTIRLQRGRVDHRGEAPAQSVIDDEIEHLECRFGGALVPLAGADHRPQAVRGDDLVGCEAAGRPRRLAAPGWTDEHHEDGLRKPDHPAIVVRPHELAPALLGPRRL